MDLYGDEDFINNRQRFWYAILALVASGLMLGGGYLFLKSAFAASNTLLSALWFLGAGYLDVQGLMLLYDGVSQLRAVMRNR